MGRQPQGSDPYAAFVLFARFPATPGYRRAVEAARCDSKSWNRGGTNPRGYPGKEDLIMARHKGRKGKGRHKGRK